MLQSTSPRQRDILEFIARHIREKGYPPSVREIGEAVGFRSSATVHAYLSRMEQKGLIRRDPAKPRTIEILDETLRPAPREDIVHVPVLGKVTAGAPILAFEEVEATFPLPAAVVHGHEVFMLRVRGDSMIGAGILDGDLVIVRRQDYAEDGEIVVALIGDEATVKRFYHEPHGMRLQPENPALEPLITREAKILGKVIGLFRRL